jgi:hypothetical protein
MGILESLKKIEQKFSWSFFGFLIGVIGISYAIYVDHFKEENPLIVFDILSNTQVLSVKEDVNRLGIIYNGENLKERQENLILLTIRILNEGEKNITEQDYYTKIPFGLKVIGGKIADKPILLDASNKFLEENLSILFDTLNNVVFNNIPLDQGQYFTIKILTVCKDNSLPSIIPAGKVSGISGEFIIRQSYMETQKEEISFLRNVTSGSFWIHVARFFFYFSCITAVSFIIVFPTSLISSLLKDKKKKRIVQKFRERIKNELSQNAEMIFDLFRSDGSDAIRWLNRTINNQNRLKRTIDSFDKMNIVSQNVDEDYFREGSAGIIHMRTMHLRTTRRYFLSKLIEKKIIVKEGVDFKVDNQFKNELQQFIAFLEYQ